MNFPYKIDEKMPDYEVEIPKIDSVKIIQGGHVICMPCETYFKCNAHTLCYILNILNNHPECM